MKSQSFLIVGSTAFGLALAAPVTATIFPPPATFPVTAWQSSMSGLPGADDPKRSDWRDSNLTVFRLGGHVGHWRGTLAVPAPAASSAMTPTPAPARRP